MLHSRDMVRGPTVSLSRIGWGLPLALILVSLLDCSGSSSESVVEPLPQDASPSQVITADWALGMDPMEVERVEYLASQLDHYRENLPALEDFGYRPAWGGIWTGLVIVCGHMVPPPYQIEADLEMDLVRLNGIELTYNNAFDVSGKCLSRLNAIRGARERAELEAKRRALDARPGVAELCAKKKEVQDASLEYFERRILELGVEVDEKTGHPNNWDLVFQACRDTKAEMERVFKANLDKMTMPESKTGAMLFSLKTPVSKSNCDGGAAIRLDFRFPDKLRYKKMYIYDPVEAADYREQHRRGIDASVKSWSDLFKDWLNEGAILHFGAGDQRFYHKQREIESVFKSFLRPEDSKRILAGLLSAGIGSVDVSVDRKKLRIEHLRDNEELIMLVLAAKEHARNAL